MKYYQSILNTSYLAIIIGFIGGYIGTLIHLPLPWLLGSLFANLLIAFTKLKVSFSNKLLNPIFLLIGIILGGTVSQMFSPRAVLARKEPRLSVIALWVGLPRLYMI